MSYIIPTPVGVVFALMAFFVFETVFVVITADERQRRAFMRVVVPLLIVLGVCAYNANWRGAF